MKIYNHFFINKNTLTANNYSYKNVFAQYPTGVDTVSFSARKSKSSTIETIDDDIEVENQNIEDEKNLRKLIKENVDMDCIDDAEVLFMVKEMMNTKQSKPVMTTKQFLDFIEYFGYGNVINSKHVRIQNDYGLSCQISHSSTGDDMDPKNVEKLMKALATLKEFHGELVFPGDLKGKSDADIERLKERLSMNLSATSSKNMDPIERLNIYRLNLEAKEAKLNAVQKKDIGKNQDNIAAIVNSLTSIYKDANKEYEKIKKENEDLPKNNSTLKNDFEKIDAKLKEIKDKAECLKEIEQTENKSKEQWDEISLTQSSLDMLKEDVDKLLKQLKETYVLLRLEYPKKANSSKTLEKKEEAPTSEKILLPTEENIRKKAKKPAIKSSTPTNEKSQTSEDVSSDNGQE